MTNLLPYASPIPGSLVDPGVAMAITVLRPSGNWLGNGLWQPDDGAPASIKGGGIVYPANSDDLAALPEGERSIKSLALYWSQRFEMNDRIQYENEQYRVVRIEPWLHYGYHKAIAQVVQEPWVNPQ